MLSGPDLGAGYLHQLSIDLDGEGTTFTFHAQDGGDDAGGPPKGSPHVFGYAPTASPCMFGGPRCWHRRFLLPRSESPRVRQAYNRNRFVLDAMVAQAYEGAPVAVESGVRAVVERLGAPLAAEGIEWYIGGSVAAWLQGAAVRPRDLDLGTTRAGVDAIAHRLSEYLIEPLAPTDWPRAGIVHGARAFVGTFREGIRVEWAVPIAPREPVPLEEWGGHAGVARLETVRIEGQPVRVTRPEYALVRAAEKGNVPHREAIAELVRRMGPDRELLGVLCARATLAPAAREALLHEVDR